MAGWEILELIKCAFEWESQRTKWGAKNCHVYCIHLEQLGAVQIGRCDSTKHPCGSTEAAGVCPGLQCGHAHSDKSHKPSICLRAPKNEKQSFGDGLCRWNTNVSSISADAQIKSVTFASAVAQIRSVTFASAVAQRSVTFASAVAQIRSVRFASAVAQEV